MNGVRDFAALAFLLALASAPAAGFDGSGAGGGGGGGEESSAPPPPTYYEDVLAGAPLASLETASGGLPGSLYVMDAAGAATYTLLEEIGGERRWRLDAEVEERPHERVDAVYDLVVAIPLPSDGGTAKTEAASIGAREGSAERSVALVYGSEKVILKRNVALERTWLPQLRGVEGGLPDLAGTGYDFTLWDAILRFDPAYGATLQARGSLEYTTASSVAAPDPDDPGLAVYVINWIPTLDPMVPPFTLRVDVTAAP